MEKIILYKIKGILSDGIGFARAKRDLRKRLTVLAELQSWYNLPFLQNLVRQVFMNFDNTPSFKTRYSPKSFGS